MADIKHQDAGDSASPGDLTVGTVLDLPQVAPRKWMAERASAPLAHRPRKLKNEFPRTLLAKASIRSILPQGYQTAV